MLLAMQIQMLQNAAKEPGLLDCILNIAVAQSDWDTADYIAKNMFSSLHAKTQAKLVSCGVFATHAAVATLQ